MLLFRQIIIGIVPGPPILPNLSLIAADRFPP
jgi:hypothetical protein